MIYFLEKTNEESSFVRGSVVNPGQFDPNKIYYIEDLNMIIGNIEELNLPYSICIRKNSTCGIDLIEQPFKMAKEHKVLLKNPSNENSEADNRRQ